MGSEKYGHMLRDFAGAFMRLLRNVGIIREGRPTKAALCQTDRIALRTTWKWNEGNAN